MTRHDLVVDPKVLVAMLAVEAPTDVTILDVRWELGRSDGRELYLQGHVPGASYVDMEANLADPVGDGTRGRHPLPDPERFAAAMRRCGVRRDRPVVVYDDSAGSAAARAWWLLTYHGHPDVRVLDRGWSAYVDADGPVETGEAAVEEGDFQADPGHLPVVDAEGAARLARDGVLLDVRAEERYRGEKEPVDPVAGHIPGAVNVPFAQTNLEPAADGHQGFRPLDDLRASYTEAGVAQTDAVGAYCGSGVTAAHTVFTLRRLGHEAALYPGSWSEWVSDGSRPVATGDAPE